MCGIAASFHLNSPAERLDLDLLSHRGPDGRGEWLSPDGRIWFGHTRLAILDLSPAGAQPMHDEETGNVIVFNGEIYNHLDLRERLSASNVKWKSTSDTETLLACYRFWGDEFVKTLNGMFAFIIYDKQRNRILASRGPLGIKPLYFEKSADRFRFASEARVLMGASRRSCSKAGLSSYLQWGSCPETEFLFPEIEILSAGHCMTVESDGTNRTWRYWPDIPPKFSPEPAVPRVRKLLEQSIARHLLSDVPVAAFLSGGIDSSVITAFAARALGNQRLRTFSVGFPHQSFDETKVAAQVAQRYGTDHQRVEVSDDEAIALVQEAVEKMDVPSVDAINTYIVSKKVAQQGIKVALSGLGADELFGGYPSFTDTGKLSLVALIPKKIRKAFSIFGNLGARLADLPSGDLMSIAIWRRRLWSDAMLKTAGLPSTPLKIESAPELQDDFAKISWAELTVYMRQMLLRDSDQMSMAVSLELRVPFLDRELVEYVLQLPQHEKKRNSGSKGLLVEACRDLLPIEVYNRPKMGFSLPMDLWIRGPLKEFSKVGLAEMERQALLAPSSIQRLQRQFDAGSLHWTRIWSLAVVGHYLKKISVNAGCGPALLVSA